MWPCQLAVFSVRLENFNTHSEAAIDLHFVIENHLEATHGFLCLFMLDLLVVCLSYTFHLKQQLTASVLFVLSIVVFFSFFFFFKENYQRRLLLSC